MRLKIKPAMQVAEVQQAFTKMFPYLKLEFYKSPGDVKAGRVMKGSMHIADLKAGVPESGIDVAPGMMVSELEGRFRDQFSLTVQVFRRSGNTWLQTTMTDDWTLQHQNEHGKEISEGIPDNKATDELDYDLDRDAAH
jgi:hypothetical protein